MEASGVSMMSRPDCRSPFFPDAADSAAAERHYRHSFSAYHHSEPLPPHSSIGHHARPSRLYAEEMPFRPVCLCHSCNVARMESRSKAYTGYPPEAEWSATLQEQYYRRDYMAAKSYVDGHSSPHTFSIHTPLRRDTEMMHNLSSPPSVSRMPKCSPQSSGFAVTPPFFPKYPFTDNQINLCKWFPIRLPDAENPAAIALGGYRVSHTSDFIKTGIIVERMRKTTLRTSDGVEVVLAGPMDMRMAIMNGFSDTVADAFYSGFPLAWKSVLSDDAQMAKMRANITSLACPTIDRVPEASPEARAEPEATVPVDNNAENADEEGIASPVSNDQVSRRSTPNPAAGETVSAVSEPPVERTPSNRNDASEPFAEPGAQEETVAASEPLGDDLAAASESFGEEARSRAAEEETPVAAEASEDVGHESVGNDKAGEMEGIQTQAGEVHMEVDGDPCPGVVDDPPDGVSDKPANTRKRSRSRARYGKKRKGRNKKSKSSNKEPEPMEEMEEPADKTKDQDQSEEQRQPTSLADKADEQDESEEPRQPASVADEPDEQHRESGDDERREEQAPAVKRKKATQRTKRSPFLPTPRRKGRGKKSTTTNKEPERIEVVEEQDQLEEQRQRTSVADKADERGQSEERRQPASVADKPDDNGDEERRQEQAPAVQRKKATPRAKRSPLPPPLPTPRVTKDEVIEAYGLKTSRSGRLLVPPLAYWRNQMVARDKDGGIIAIFEGFEERPSDTGNFNFKAPTQKKAVKLQEKLCAAASESPLASKPAGRGRRRIR